MAESPAHLRWYPAELCVPVWSPDVSKIAFSTTRNPPTKIFIVNVDGSGLIQLTNTDNVPEFDRGNASPSWGF